MMEAPWLPGPEITEVCGTQQDADAAQSETGRLRRLGPLDFAVTVSSQCASGAQVLLDSEAGGVVFTNEVKAGDDFRYTFNK